MGRDAIMIGHETIDLRYVEQLVDSEQLNTLGQIVRFLEEEIFDGKEDAWTGCGTGGEAVG